MSAVFVVATIVFFLVFDFTLTRVRRRAAAPAIDLAAFPDDAVAMGNGLFLSPGHTWASVEADGDVRLGADALVRRAVGKLTAVSLPCPGDRVRKGDTLVRFAAGDRHMTLRSPVTGIVSAVNPSPLRTGPQDWLLRVEPSNLSAEIRTLRVAGEAMEWLRAEAARFRDFLLSALPASPAMATLPDGGVPADGVLRLLPEKSWSEFEAEFLKIED